ncbi:MAG: glutamine synthetase III [Longimicrobiales bacterium]
MPITHSRFDSLSAATSWSPDQSKAPGNGESNLIERVFGENTFGLVEMKTRLTEPVFKQMMATMEEGKRLDPTIADAVANAMKEWALSRGATHYTHWFQPLTGNTAEKHDSFLKVGKDGRAMTEFSGGELVQGEPDASSFPSGGLRATFEARGYTAWDPTSPAFLREGEGATYLCIPTAFTSWAGDSLDKKVPLLRSMDALSRVTLRALALFGVDAKAVMPSVGPEQEFFLIDQEFYYRRPDLMTSGRTLFGAKPPRGQELDDQYFGAIHERVLAFMQATELELYRLGVPVKTRHNEVAPHQFEMAPVYENANIAADHQQLMMTALQKNARDYGFVCLLHEKPFAGINGSGKHLNWSFGTANHNLLEPGDTPHDNEMFLFFCTAVLRAVERHQDLLRTSIATAGNDHRLGANEAPPSIISVFLGDQLQDIFEQLEKSGSATESKDGGLLGLGVEALPELPKHSGDRNRTSPFAFTGNKFEFRALGSSASVSFPATILNTIVAESVDELTAQLEEAVEQGADLEMAVQKLLAREVPTFKRIIFNGDGYADEWVEEAESRGLLNLKTTVDALPALTDPKNEALFEKYGVLTPRELESRAEVRTEQYFMKVNIEGETAAQMARTMLLPAAIRYLSEIMGAHEKATAAGVSANGLKATADSVAGLIDELSGRLDALNKQNSELGGDTLALKALHMRDNVIPAMNAVREVVDRLERVVPDDLWPIPTYRDMLFVK